MDIHELLRYSFDHKASDLHLSPKVKPTLRIHGDLAPVESFPVLTPADTKTMILSLMDKEQQRAFEISRELDFAINLPDEVSFRVNAFFEVNGMAAVFRVIPNKAPTLDELNTPPIFKQLLDLSSGLILVTGPTGSGKSTTLAAMIDYINTYHDAHIITIEDPIEFSYTSNKSLINQRQVLRDTTSFPAALRAALREDPDVILVGEMRDLETIRLALTAAETGHLVMATLHTSSAPHSVNRIIDVFPAGEKNVIRNMLSESLQAVICQSLIKNIQGERIAAYEIMLATTAIRNLIREDKVAQMSSVIQTSADKGMCTLDQYLKQLMNKKLISPESLAHSGNKRELFTDA